MRDLRTQGAGFLLELIRRNCLFVCALSIVNGVRRFFELARISYRLYQSPSISVPKYVRIGENLALGRILEGSMGEQTLREADLYEPVSKFLIEQGFTVRSEVQHCDVVAISGDEMIVVELKRSLNLRLLVQATQRQQMTESVYLAIPRPKQKLRSREWRGILHLVRRLELGLMFVSLDSPVPSVQVVVHPRPFMPKRNHKLRNSVLREAMNRTADYNVGGSTQRPLMTAYKEHAIFIAVCLE